MYGELIDESTKCDTARRFFLKALYAAPALVIFGLPAKAEEYPAVGENDPAALSVGYTHISDSKEKNCANCRLYQGETGAEWGQCSIFPKRVVSASGWCKSWATDAD